MSGQFIPRAKLTHTSVIDLEKNHTVTKNSVAGLVDHTKNVFKSGKTRPASFRKQQLQNLFKFMVNEEENLIKALDQDLKKSKHESLCSEIYLIRKDINDCLNNLDKWMKPEKVKKSVANALDDLYIYSDPYGVVLVIGAWNYPLYVLLTPVIGAIAGGNCVIIKPSEVAQATAHVLATLLPKYLDNDCYPVFSGGVEETSELLKHKFDYIFYTGSTQVGKIVHQAAAQHLTPTTLELGGKSPVYIDNSANLKLAAKRILWGKTLNSGQTCVAPDYILCTKDVQLQFLDHIEDALKEFFKGAVKTSPDFGRIVNQRHFERLTNLLKNQNIAIGGHVDADERFISPTVLIDVHPEDAIMQEEIFGPLLPIINIKNEDEAIEFINRREKPLTLYVFTTKCKTEKNFLENTSSGSVLVNDTIMQLVADGLHFGGVGESGMGAYHGKVSFDTFVHKKSVLSKSYNIIGEKLESARYPPYTSFKTKLITTVMKHNHSLPTKYIPHILMFTLGVAITISSYYICEFIREEKK